MEKVQIDPSEQIAHNWVVWLDALASGDYKKTVGALHKIVDGEERHCCLGVAQICLGLDKIEGGTDYRLVELLGLRSEQGYSFNRRRYITTLNDKEYEEDTDFVNMHRELLADLEGFTDKHPEVAPLVRKMLAERNT